MEGFEKGFSASKSTASPKRSITGSGENNENDSNQEQSNSNSKFHNHKKVVVKHFMSPTISAASKAAAPRKKILAERNENSSVSDDENKKKGSRNSGISHSDRSLSRVVSSYSQHESDEEGNINSVDDSSVKAYDPLTNYLSPRPKYLRFDPNKRREILNRIEKEEKELNSSSDSQEVDDEEESSVEDVKGIVKVETEKSTEKEDGNMNNDYDEEEEEEEELEEERGWCLRGLLKVILTLIACLLSTSYICSMNSPITSPTQQAISNLKDSYLMIKKQTIEGFTLKIREAGFFKVGEEDNYDEVEEIEMDEEDENGETEENIEEEIVEDEANLEGRDEELGGKEIVGVKDGEIENIEEEIVEDEANLEGRDEELGGNENENDAEIEGVRDSEIESKLEKVEQLLGEKTDESGTFCLEQENEASYDDLNEDNIHKIAEIVEGGEVEYETEQLDEKTDQSEEIIGSHEKLTDSGHEEIGNDAKGEIEKMGWNNNTSAIIGVSIVSIVLTSLAFIYRSKKTIRTIDEESRPVLKPHKFSVEEQVTPVLPKKKIEFSARPEELNRHIGALPEKKIEFSARPKEANHHIGAPTVELIGEFVVGQMSSLRIGERKHEMNGSEERNASSFLKQAQPASTPAKLSEHEYSTTNSPSYGSFTTTEKKISRKEGGRSEEPLIDTPVRRSTRIRNRAAVTSP